MSVRQVQLKRNGGTPEVEIIVGQAHIGVYRCFLWDQDNVPTQVGHGNNTDQLPDKYPLRPPADLATKSLGWEVIIQSAEANAGQLYSLTVLIRQDGSVAHGGVIQENGPLTDGTKAVIGFARFELL